MEWYYSENNQQRGPVDDAQFAKFVQEGMIKADTLVWNNTMTDWKPYGQIAASMATSTGFDPAFAGPGVNPSVCSQCGLSFPPAEMIQYGSQMICASCKPAFFQRVREGVNVTEQMVYAGFWIRFCAKFIDGIILGVSNALINFFIGMVLGATEQFSPLFFVMMLFNYGLQCAYVTYFIGRHQATPGKMAMKLKVVRPDGGRITYGRALGRYFGEILSGLVFLIGYIIAAFDEEKRALHDRICDTRVIRV